MDQDPRAVKLNAELQRNTERIEKLQIRNKEILEMLRRIRNTRIIGLFEAFNMTPEEFAELAERHRRAPEWKEGADEEA